MAGDVAVGPGDVAPVDAPPEADIDRFGDVAFADLFAKSLRRLGEPGRGWALAGVQAKVPASRIAFPVRTKRGATSWILKLGSPDLPHLVENEAYFLEAARACGLVPPAFRVVHDREGATGLLVERFDRVPTSRVAPPLRVHQEDACQFLDRYPADKYRLTLREIADGLADVCAAPVLGVAHLMRLQAFSFAIANGDLHAKNVSVLRDPASRRVGPAPAYDLLSTLPYGDDHMALPMEGRDRNLRRRDFVAFGERLGVRPAATAALLDRIVAGLAPYVADLERIGFDAKRTAHLRRTIARRLDALR